MAYFKIAYKMGKKRDSIVIEAPNKAAAMEAFLEKKIGIFVKIEKVSKPFSWYFKELDEKFQNPIKDRPANLQQLIAILDQIAVMLDAGLPLNFVLDEAVKNQKDKMLKAIFEQIKQDIEGGKGFYASASRYKRQLGPITLSMIRLGEETGQLAESLQHLTSILQNILDNRQKFKKATRYPIFIMMAMIIAFTIVTIFVIPQFKSFFESSNMKLPLPTLFLLWLESSIRNYGPYILSGAILIAVTTAYLYKHNRHIRLILDKVLLKIIVIGKATLYAMISRFTYVFMVLTEAGIPMIEALDIADEIVENSYIKQRIALIPAAIEEGRSLYQGFEEAQLFENMVVEMVKAGETSGALGKMLEKASKVYQDRFNYIVDNIATLIEPILIAAIAGFVLTLALGIFLPMWNMVNLA